MDRGYSPSRYFVTPTGTTEMLFTAGYIPAKSCNVLSRAGPSLMPGQDTIWQFMVMWFWANRSMISMLSPARRFFSISARSARSVVWTDTLMGEIRRSIIRCTSRGDRFVKVR